MRKLALREQGIFTLTKDTRLDDVSSITTRSSPPIYLPLSGGSAGILPAVSPEQVVRSLLFVGTRTGGPQHAGCRVTHYYT